MVITARTTTKTMVARIAIKIVTKTMVIMPVGGSSKDHTPEQDFSSHQIFRIYQLYMSQSTWKDGGGAGALLGPSTRSADQKKT